LEENKSPKVRNKVVKTALMAAVVEYHNQGWSQQRIANHLGYSRSYIRKLLSESPGTQDQRLNPNPVLNECPTNTDGQEFPVPELQRVMEVVQADCRKLILQEKEAVRNQVLEDLQLERRLYLNAIILLGASPVASLNAPYPRKVEQFINGLQQLSGIIHRNTQALIKIYGLDAEKNVDLDMFNIDFMAAARAGGLKETKYDIRPSNSKMTDSL